MSAAVTAVAFLRVCACIKSAVLACMLACPQAWVPTRHLLKYLVVSSHILLCSLLQARCRCLGCAGRHCTEVRLCSRCSFSPHIRL